MSLSKKALVVLLLVLLIGAGLRFYHSTQESLWIDEAHSARYAQMSSPQEVVEGITKGGEGAPVGHYLLLHYWGKFFGFSAFSLRFISILSGIAAIGLMFLLSRKLYNEKTALLAALFLATSMLQVLYSQEARLYALYGFLALLTAYCFTIIIQKGKEATRKDYFLYVFTMLLACYTNYLTAILFVFYSLLLVWYKERIVLKPWLISKGAIIIGCLPLLPTFFGQYASSSVAITERLVQRGLPLFLAKFGLFFFLLPGIAFLALIAYGVYHKEKVELFLMRYRITPNVFLGFLVLSSLVYVYLVTSPLSIFGQKITSAPITQSFFLIRHFFFLVPLFYLFLAVQITKLPTIRLRHVAVVLLLLVNFFALLTYYTEPTKAQWQEAAHIIDEQAVPLVLVDSGGISSKYLYTHYVQGTSEPLYVTWTDEQKRKTMWLNDEEIKVTLENKEEVIFLETLKARRAEHFKELLNQEYTLANTWKLHEISVYLYEK